MTTSPIAMLPCVVQAQTKGLPAQRPGLVVPALRGAPNVEPVVPLVPALGVPSRALL